MCEAIRAAANNANKAAVLTRPSWESFARALVHRAGRAHSRIKLDLAEGAFVVGHILVQDGREGLRLLRTQVNTLKISHLNLIVCLLLHGPEHQKKVPDIDPYLHAVGISLAIVGGIDHIEIRLCGNNHKALSLAGMREEGKSALHFWIRSLA